MSFSKFVKGIDKQRKKRYNRNRNRRPSSINESEDFLMSEPKMQLMEEGTILTLIDENDKEAEFEAIATLELDGKNYVGLTPTEEDLETDDGMLVILVSETDESGETTFTTIDSEDEYDRIGQIFLEELNNLYFEDADDEP